MGVHYIISLLCMYLKSPLIRIFKKSICIFFREFAYVTHFSFVFFLIIKAFKSTFVTRFVDIFYLYLEFAYDIFFSYREF